MFESYLYLNGLMTSWPLLVQVWSVAQIVAQVVDPQVAQMNLEYREGLEHKAVAQNVHQLLLITKC